MSPPPTYLFYALGIAVLCIGLAALRVAWLWGREPDGQGVVPTLILIPSAVVMFALAYFFFTL